jgi:aldehyde dehydrogenase (NAD+)
MDIVKTVGEMRSYFNSGATLPLPERKKNLRKIKALLLKYRERFNEAFQADYNKGEFDVLTTEFFLVLSECDYQIKHLKAFTKAKRVRTSLFTFPSKGYRLQEPYGVILIMAPWNYPFQLALEPLLGALAAGNCCLIKPASYAAHVSKTIADLFEEFGQPGLVSVVLGGREENQALLDQRFDYIFFTGGATVGRVVLEKAAVHLTPVSLELGGKSPCLVDEDADLEVAARRIVWGKFLNAGMTCVAPDYLYVHEKVHDQFVEAVLRHIKAFYYEDGKLSADFPHIINEKHLAKVTSFLQASKIIWGGKVEGLAMEPTVLDRVTWDDPCMKEEIFGPIMPILTFSDLDSALKTINSQEKPLAFYYFSKNLKKARSVMALSPFGGGCINDTIMYLTSNELPFGGVGRSGMGHYHGQASFTTFSHEKSVLVKGHAELMLKYPPYTAKKLAFVKKLKHLQ